MATNEEELLDVNGIDIKIQACEPRCSFLAMNFVSLNSLSKKLIKPLKELLESLERQVDNDARKDERFELCGLLSKYVDGLKDMVSQPVYHKLIMQRINQLRSGK